MRGGSLSSVRGIGVALAASTVLFVLPGVAAAAQGPPPGSPYNFYVGCSGGAGVAPAELCDRGGRPSAFFESPGAEVEYEICLSPPGKPKSCRSNQIAEAGVLYENTLEETTRPGNYYVTWSVGGAEVGSWDLDVEQIELPSGSRQAVLGCMRSAEDPSITFAPHPRICTEFRHYEINAANEIWMSRLHWRDWGAQQAYGRGRWKNCSTGSCRAGAVKLVAMHPRLSCGIRAYTRLRITVIGAHGARHYSIATVNC